MDFQARVTLISGEVLVSRSKMAVVPDIGPVSPIDPVDYCEAEESEQAK
jgi:hypothetical protein